MEYRACRYSIIGGTRIGHEFVGLCLLYPDTRLSFYVNSSKILFYCRGCGQGRDLLRFIQLSHHLSFRHNLAYLQQQSDPPADPAPAIQPKTVAKIPASIRTRLCRLRYFEAHGGSKTSVDCFSIRETGRFVSGAKSSAIDDHY